MTDRPIIFSAPEAFARHIIPEPNSGCWLWNGVVNANGYGRYHHGGRSEMAHRAALRFSCVSVPSGFEVDHLCRVRCCVNPEHLDVVTHRENLLRGNTITAVAAKTTHCPAGHALTGDNLRTRNGKRRCKECDRARQMLAYSPKTTRRRRRHLDRREIAGIRSALAAGLSHSAISVRFNISIATVSNVRRGKNNYG